MFLPISAFLLSDKLLLIADKTRHIATNKPFDFPPTLV